MWLRKKVILYGGLFLCLYLTVENYSLAQCLKVNVGVLLDKNANPCNGPITLDAHFPNYQHTWNTGAQTQKIEVNKDGRYIVTVDDGNGCIGRDTVDVVFLDKPSISLGLDTISQCGGCVHLDPGSGSGLTYQWSTGDTTEAINYCKVGSANIMVKVTNELGCYVSDTVNVTISPGLTVHLGNDTITCDSVVNLDAGNPGVKHLWNTGDTTQTVQIKKSGVYYVDVEDAVGCKGIDTIHIRMNPTPHVDLGADPKPVCGSCIHLDAGNFPSSTIQWSTGQSASSINYCTLGTQDVSVKVTNEFGCSDADTVHVSIDPGLEVDLGEDFLSCDKEVLLDPGFPGMNYKWNTGDTTEALTVTKNGVYSVLVTDAKGCTGTDTVSISFGQIPVVNLGSDPAPKCGGCVKLDGGMQPNSNYAWSTGDTTQVIDFCQQGTYDVWLTVFNDQGCDNSDTITVTIKSGYHFSLGSDTSLCTSPLTLNGPNYPGASYHWSNGQSTSSINVSTSGTYTLSISNMNGCDVNDTISDSIHVTFNSAFAAPSDILDFSDCHTKKFTASNVIGATSYTWTVPTGCSIVSGQGTPTVVVGYSGTINGNVSVVAGNGNPSCQSVPAVLPVYLDGNPLNIPNAFSPNNDGINDTWVIRNIQYYPENELMVLNRWGNEVYRQQHYKNEWDGGGLNEGSYFYKLKVNFCDEEKVITGYITIVR